MFVPALELWSVVQSVTGQDSVVLTFGKRDCRTALDSRNIFGPHRAAKLPATGFLSTARAPRIRTISTVSDRACGGISRPRTAFDKWRALAVIDDEYNVLDVYRTYY